MLYISLLLALLAVACLIFVPNTVILLSFVAIMHGFAVYSACHALLHKRDSRAALGWIAIILFMPPVGLPLYWLFGIARIDSQAVRLMEKAAQKVMGGLVDLHGKSLTEKPEGFIDKDEVPHAWHYLVNPGSSITGRCMLEGNDLTVLQNGEAAYPVMLKAISEAKERVFLSSFIFGYDEVGKSFAAALRAMLRQAPNIIMIGEIRDMETASIAINASLTGHLVFSTLHTNDAPSAVARLADIGIKRFLIASSVRAIMAQRLVRKLCDRCKVDGTLTEKQAHTLNIDMSRLAQGQIKAPHGCDFCRGGGFKGRMGLFEIFEIDDEVRRMINENLTSPQLRQRARELGMRTLREDGVRKVLAGLTSPEEVLNVTMGDAN